jgi:hypothetical protein
MDAADGSRPLFALEPAKDLFQLPRGIFAVQSSLAQLPPQQRMAHQGSIDVFFRLWMLFQMLT